MRNDFNPWEPFRQGQQAEQGLAQAEQEGLGWRERLAMKRAASQLGAQNYFAGYEGVPGAERPDYLKEAWANADPAQSMQLESLLAEPFKMNRAAQQAGKIEAAKKASDLDYNKALIQEFYTSLGAQEAAAQGANAFGPSTQAPGSGVLLPGQSMSGSAGAPASPSAVERTFEITPTGPKFGMKTLSPFEQSMKQGEDTVRRENLTLSKTKESRETVQQAHENVRKITDQILATRQAMENRNMPWETGQQQLQLLQQDLSSAQQRRDGLLGASSGVASPSPMVSTGKGGPFTEKQQSQIGMKDVEEKNTAANKETVAVRERAKGQTVVRTVISSLRDHFSKLNEMGGITNTEKDPVSNLAAGAASSAGGQVTGKLLGTKSQSLRNTIAQQRPLLMQAVMKATGMTAKQMDSNVELKLWLATATDPTVDFQSNMKALDMLEQLYGQEIRPETPVTNRASSSTSMTTTVPAFHDPEKQKRYEEFKKQHKP